jgi:hypothetical protein
LKRSKHESEENDLNSDYEQLIHYLEGMMNDGVQLVHGGQLFGWDDTNIPELLGAIKQKTEEAKQAHYDAGDILKDKNTGQYFAVIWSDDSKVHITPNKTVLIYTSKQASLQFEKVTMKDKVHE